jgi:hypothetical protein
MSIRNLLTKFRGCFAALIVGALTACASANTGAVAKADRLTDPIIQPTATPNPYACQTGTTPRVESQDHDLHIVGVLPLDCSCLTSVTRGLSWKGLTIGESTLADVQSVLETEGVQSPQDGAWWFEDLHEPRVWFNAEACFVDEKLSILYIGLDTTDRMYLDEMFDEYGDPNRITWGQSYETEWYIWSEKGVAILVSKGIGLGFSFFMFSPIPSEALEGSWVMATLPQQEATPEPPAPTDEPNKTD